MHQVIHSGVAAGEKVQKANFSYDISMEYCSLAVQ